MRLAAARVAPADAIYRAQRRVVAALAAAALGAVAVGFATAGLFLALLAGVGAVAACLIVAGVYLALALIAYFTLRPRIRRLPPHAAPPPMTDDEAAARLISMFLSGLRTGRGAGRPPPY